MGSRRLDVALLFPRITVPRGGVEQTLKIIERSTSSNGRPLVGMQLHHELRTGGPDRPEHSAYDGGLVTLEIHGREVDPARSEPIDEGVERRNVHLDAFDSLGSVGVMECQFERLDG